MNDGPDMAAGYDLAVTGGTIVSATGRTRADVGIRDGRIGAIVEPGVPLAARATIDAERLAEGAAGVGVQAVRLVDDQ